jgi:hypothetical protein
MVPTPDLNQLAAQIVAGLSGAAPLGEGILKGIGGEVGKAGVQGLVRLWQSVRGRFAADANQKGLKVLDLFQEDPKDEDQASALGKQILQALAASPAWAAQMRTLVDEGPTQEIIARNDSIVRTISMRMAGPGRQRIEADGSTVEGVTMSINSGSGDDRPPGASPSSTPPTPPATPRTAPGKLTGPQVQQIQDAIVAGYTPDSLQEMVRTQLDQDLAAIAHGDTFRAQVFSLIDWAERQGRVADLLLGACAANPGNVALRRVWAELQAVS